MSVRVYEAGEDDSPAGIDKLGLGLDVRLHLFAFPDARNAPIAYDHRAIFHDRKRAHLWTDARTSRPSERDELRAIGDG
jgi:hypothetical protein